MATSFPALAIQNQESPLKQFGEAQAIVGQMQQRQMGEIQLQQARQNQQSQQALMRLFSQNKGDMDKTYSDAVDSGQVTPEHLNAFRNANLEAQTKAATLGKDKLELHQKLNEATANELDGIQALPLNRRPQAILDAYGRLRKLGADPNELEQHVATLIKNPADDAIAAHQMTLMGSKWVADEALKRLELNSKPTAGQAQAKTAAELDKSQNDALAAHQTLLNMPTAEEAKSKRWADLHETLARTAQAKADTAEKIAQTQLVGAQPVFAFDPQTNQRVLTTMPQTGAKGLTNPVKASEGDINKETELTRQFNDVQMNVSRYRNAVNNPNLQLGQNGFFSASDTTKIANILSDEKLAGVAGHIPAGGRLGDIISQGKNAQYWDELSPEAQDMVTGYLRAKGSIIAFQKALTQTGRTSKEALAIEMQNLPSPLMGTAPANKQIDAFQENIDTASKGVVRVPWLPTPQDVRQSIEASPQAKVERTPFAPGSGQYRNAGGNKMQVGQEAYDNATKQYIGTVSKVYPNGTYDVSRE